MLKHGTFKASDLLKLPALFLDATLTYLLSNIVRCAEDKEKLSLIREALTEIDQFCVDVMNKDEEQSAIN